MFARRFMVYLAISGLFLTSFAFFCTRRGSAVIDFGIQASAQISQTMTDQFERMAACLGDTKLGFYQTNPISLAGELPMLALGLVAVFIIVSTSGLWRSSELRQDRLRQKFKRSDPSYLQPPLAFAFSRGIIHSKRYAK